MPLLLLGLALCSAVERVELTPPVPAVAVVIAPGQSSERSDTSAILSAFSRAIERETDLRVASPEQIGLDVPRLLSCPPEARLSCWAKEVGALGAQAPRYLFVLSVSRRESDSALLSALLLDVEAARRQLGSPDEVEAAIFDASARTVPIALVGVDETAARLAQVELRDALERAGRWSRLGRIELTLDCADCEVSVDEASLGTVATGELQIERVPAGSRVISVRRAGALRWSEAVEVGAGAARKLRVDPSAVADPGGSRPVLLFGGASVGAAGAVLGAIGLAGIAGRPVHACVVPSVDERARCVDPSSDGRALTAAGAGLAAAGVSWLTLSLIDDTAAWPEWLPFALGAAVGSIGGVVAAATTP